jgi:hypothetical protein
MNREMMRSQLTLADEMIATRQAQIEKQRSEIAELRRNGLDVTKAQAALEDLELSLALYKQHRDRLAEEFKK